MVCALSRAERVELVEWDGREFSISQQACLLDLNRTSLYYRPPVPSPEELTLKRRIDEIYLKHPFYGSRRIHAVLGREGFQVNRKRIQTYMREMGIAGICPGPNLSKRRQDHKVYPYLLKGLDICRPNQVWGIDITYIPMRSQWMYLVAIIDWFSRYVVSWELDQTLEVDFVIDAVQRALAQSVPEIINSDQGSHFTSPRYIDLLKPREIRISMDSRGRALDNVFTERLWRSLKYEEVYPKEYGSPREARQGIGSYLRFYNEDRPHQSLGYQTPIEVYRTL